VSRGAVSRAWGAAAGIWLVVACSGSSSKTAPATEAGPGFDDDTQLLAHCAFEAPPTHPTLPAPSPGAIRAGFGSALLSLPIGVPFGGYTERSEGLRGATPIDGRAARWSVDFVPSAGVADAPRAEALALQMAGQTWVIARVDTVLITSPVTYAVEDALAADGSMRGHVTISASHSHGAWAAWQPTYWLTPGTDRPRNDLFQRVVAAITSAAQQALAALEPARIGIAVDDAFDPQDTVSHDRRPENDDILGPDGNKAGQNKDPVVWAMRVDRADGSPMAALVDVPIHGTVGDENNPFATRDAPGWIERALGAKLGYPVLHLQGATGDIAPADGSGRNACPDEDLCLDMPWLEILGARATAIVAPLVQGIQTSDSAAMEIVNRPVYVGHAGVVNRPSGTNWYIPPDTSYVPDGIILDGNGWAVSPIDEFNAPAGAGLCGTPTSGSIAPIPGTSGMGSYSSCLSISRGGDIVFAIYNLPTLQLPLCDSVRLNVSAVRIAGLPSGDWLILGIPGEPLAPFTSYLRGRSPAGRDHTLVVGYVDHGGYMMTAEDWLAGGYETTISIWGPLEGEMVIDGVLGAATIAWTPEIEDPEAGSTRSPPWPWPGDSKVPVVVTTDHGTLAYPSTMLWPDTIVASTPPQPPTGVVRATGVARFTWYGGDPAVDFPEVNVEVMSPQGFVPLVDANGKPASSYDGAVVVSYQPDPLPATAPAHHIYGATWQPVPPDPFSLDMPSRAFSLPAGGYRLHAYGTAMTASGPVPYDVVSDPFDVMAAPLGASSTVTIAGSAVTVVAVVSGAPGLRALQEGPSDGDVPLPGPWSVTLSMTDGTTQSATASPDASGSATVPFTGSAQVASVEVRDPWGNGGTMAPP
jgi:neutral ceramidase